MSRNAEHNQRMRDERRVKILSCALQLFATRGLHATKITDIAAEARMAQGLLYHYFRSKEEIYTELIRRAFERMNSAVRALEEAPMSPREKIRTALIQLLKSIEESDEFARTILLNAQAGISEATPPEAQAIIRAESGVPYGVVARILAAGQRDGSIKPYDAEELAMVFWTTIKGLALHKAVYGAAFKAPDPSILTSMFFIKDAEGEDDV